MSLLLTLIALLACGAACKAAGDAAPAHAFGGGVTAHVTTGEQLASAIRDPTVSRIVLDTDVRLAAKDWPDEPYRLARNLTVTSDFHGPHRVIDFNARDVKNRLIIGAGKNLSFVHVTVKDTRYGAGAAVDILAPSPDGILFFTDAAKVQTSCAPLVKKNILAYQRDPSVPGTNVIDFPEVVDWDGKAYIGNIVYRNFSTRMAVGENVADAGYVVHKLGSYKLCEKVVDAACLAKHDATTCVRNDQDAVYAALALDPAPPAPFVSAGAKAGAAMGAAGAAAAVAAAALLVLHRRRRAVRSDKAGAADVSDESSDSFEPSKPWDVERGGGRPGHGGPSIADSARPSTEGALSAPALSGSAGSRAGSDGSGPVVLPSRRGSSRALPDLIGGTLTREQAASIQLGTLVGVGSFGRVFRGSLGGQEYAIKVIHHNRAAAKAVTNEVALTMGFDHRNLVRGRHYLTWGSAGVSHMTRPELDFDSSQLVGTSLGMTLPSGSMGGASSGAGSAAGRGDSGALRPQRPLVETWILVEFCEGGNLQDAVMEKSSGPFFDAANRPQLAVMLRTLRGVAAGMEWLHAQNVLHGDLKAGNVMLQYRPRSGQSGASPGAVRSGEALVSELMEEGPGALAAAVASGAVDIVPKVADFGLSRIMNEGATHLSTHTVGTITHQAPELIKTGRLSKPADCFSFGVMMWEVLTAQQPWQGMMMGEIMTAVVIENRRLHFPAGVPAAVAGLAAACMAEDAAARPTFADLAARLAELQSRAPDLQAEADAAAAARQLLAEDGVTAATASAAAAAAAEQLEAQDGTAAAASTAAAAGAGAAAAALQPPLAAVAEGVEGAPH